MEYIKEIIGIVNKKRLSKIDIFDSSLLSTEDSLFSKLYLELNDGKIEDDTDAAQFLYGNNPDAKYRKLKSRFVKRLLNTLFFVDINETVSRKNHYTATELSQNKILTQCNILRLMRAKSASDKIIRQNYAIADKYGFTDISLAYSTMLLSSYAFAGDRNKYLKEKENFLLYSMRNQLETKARVLYYDIVSRLTWSSNLSTKETNDYIDELNNLEKENIELKSYYGFYAIAQNKIILYELLNDYDLVYVECEKAIVELSKYEELQDKAKISGIVINMIKACLNLGKYEEGYRLCENNLKVFNKDGNNQSLIYSKYFHLAMHNNDLELANNIYQNLIGEGLYTQKTTKSLTQIWAVNEAYLIFLIQHKKARHINEELYNKTFRTTQFENNVYNLMHDKSGYGTGIHIIMFLFALLKDDRDYVFDRKEALKMYRTRYLKKDSFKRSALFFKMILTVAEKNFDAFKLKQLHEKNYLTLKENPENSPILEWEIIPYDRLWLYILEILKGR